MNPSREEVLANLQYAAQFQLSKATAALFRRGETMPSTARSLLFEAIEDAGAFLGDYGRAGCGIRGHNFEAYLLDLFTALERLHHACRIAGVPSGDYAVYRQLLCRGEHQPA